MDFSVMPYRSGNELLTTYMCVEYRDDAIDYYIGGGKQIIVDVGFCKSFVFVIITSTAS